MTSIITPALVRRYLIAMGWTQDPKGWIRDGRTLPNSSLRHPEIPGPRAVAWCANTSVDDTCARLGMLAAAEMAKPIGVSTSKERALYVGMIEAAGVDPEAWEKARGA